MEAKLWTGKCTEWMSESREVGAEEDEEKPGREGDGSRSTLTDKKGTRTSEGRWKKGEKNRYIHRDSAEMQRQSVGWDSQSAIQLCQHAINPQGVLI